MNMVTLERVGVHAQVLQLQAECKTAMAALIEHLKDRDDSLNLDEAQGRVLADLRRLSWA